MTTPTQHPARTEGELKTCPFCGGVGRIESGGPHEPDDWCGWCPACDYSLEFKASRSEALAAWNRRALSTPARPGVDREVVLAAAEASGREFGAGLNEATKAAFGRIARRGAESALALLQHQTEEG